LGGVDFAAIEPKVAGPVTGVPPKTGLAVKAFA
jgi:hypothetical protein